MLLAVATLFIGLSLFSYSESDPSYTKIVFSRYQESVHNLFGKAGAYAADLLGTVFGWCALFIPFVLVYVLFQLVKLYRGKISRTRTAGALFSAAVFLLSAAVLSGIIGGQDLFFKDTPSGGVFGVTGGTIVAGILGRAGGIILCSLILLLSVLGIIRISFTELGRRFSDKYDEIKSRREEKAGQEKPEEEKEGLFGRIINSFRDLKDDLIKNLASRSAARAAAKRRLTEERVLSHTPVPAAEIEPPKEEVCEPLCRPQVVAEPLTADSPGVTPPPLIVPPFTQVYGEEDEYEEDAEEDGEHVLDGFRLPEGEEFLTVSRLEELLAEYEKDALDAAGTEEPQSAPLIKEYDQKVPPAAGVRNIVTGKDYKLSFSLLDAPDGKVTPPEPEELREKADLLLSKLRDFGVDGRIREIRPGPVVTLFELEPAPGIKINKIANLENDLALAMSALSIRIIAPIPGKAAVGIEVPNPARAMVSLRELLEAKEFKQDESPLAVALGKDISGRPYFTDLRKMPHLLVAGTTGSGKSVCVNSIICSVLFKSAPDKVKFVMIDPKMVELSVYEGIPHLAAPVVTDPRKANAVLQNVVKEMESRYALLASCRVRSMDSYNNYIEIHPESAEGMPYSPMPYMVVIVDEFADLMMVAGKEVENSIIRIAQMARAVGIHLVLATQRPSVNVITGIIKANMPARISFKVSSKIDSRTILDQNGAELLLGRGDSLFIPPGSSDPLRIHGCFVSESEVLRVVEELKKYGEPEYNMALLEEHSENGGDFDEEEFDSRYEEALRIVREKGFASISMIQRYLKIGYNRAARIVEMMERQGLIGPSDGTSKPRELLKRD